MLEKTVYYTPYMSILIKKQEDIICTSADTDIPFGTPDTDVPFDLDGMGNDIF